MSIEIGKTPDELRTIRETAEQVPITGDFTSYLQDVNVGNITSINELDARLNPEPSGFVYDRGQLLYKAGLPVRESRQVTRDQKEIIRTEAACKAAISTNNTRAGDFFSFAQDIRSGEITSIKELNARLSPEGTFVYDSDGRPFYKGNTIMRERRQVGRDQNKALKLTASYVQAENRNQTTVTDAASFARDINDGKIKTDKELLGRFQPKNTFVYVDGNTLYNGGVPVREMRQVKNKTLQEVLRVDRNELGSVRKDASDSQDCTSFLRDIVDGNIASEKELRGRLNPSSTLVYVDGQPLYRGNTMVRETRSVSREQKAALLAIRATVAKLSDKNRKDLARELRVDGEASQLDKALEASYAQAMTAADANGVKEQRQAADDVSRAWRRAFTDAKVYDTILKTRGDTEPVFRQLRDDPEEDLTDRQRAERLTAACYTVRRADTTSRVLALLATEEAPIDTALATLNEFANSPDPADRERALTLTKTAYEAELLRTRSDLIGKVLDDKIDLSNYAQAIGALKIRPDVDDFSYVQGLKQVQADLEPIKGAVKQSRLDQEVYALQKQFDERRPNEVVEVIQTLQNELGGDTRLAETLTEYYKLYLTSRREVRREDYEQVFGLEVAALRSLIAPDYEFDQELGANLDAAKALASKFSEVVLPLVNSLRGEPGFDTRVERFLTDEEGQRTPRNRFIQDVERLAAQRDLTNNERSYLESVQALSAFNPYLVAAANVNPGLTSAYLESYFKRLSTETKESLDGSYVPLLQIGMGPNGLASLGELMRMRPDVAQQSLVVDEAELPGGPFAIPKGAAWDLNSANSSGFDGPRMPDAASSEIEGKRVRDYGSPLRWYPGERSGNNVTRPGSINTTVDYLLNPDVISSGRYPTNEDMALVLQLQAGMLVNKAALSTSVLAVEDAPANAPGSYRVMLQYRDAEGATKVADVYTDGIIASSGLGQPSYGIDLSKSRARNVLAQTSDTQGFPALSDTLTAFKALASKETDSPIPGKTVVIYGNGNSADTLVEYLGGLFESSNPNIRNIEKIYIVTDGQLSKRPRYSQISDLRARNGRENLVEIVPTRVGDVDFADSYQPNDGPVKLRLFDKNGSVVRDNEGRNIEANNVIAATGFQPAIAEALAGLGATTKDERGRDRLQTKPVTLPTAANVSVAETVEGRDNVLLVGTGSKASFDITDKLLQLPTLARQALLRNGAENAVAIGFRAPDTQAAVRLYLENNYRTSRVIPDQPERVLIDATEQISAGTALRVEPPKGGLPALRRDVASGSETLSPLLLSPLANVKLVGTSDATYTAQLTPRNGVAEITIDQDMPAGVASILSKSASDPYFQAYARNAIRLRRDSEGVKIKLTFQNGRLLFKESYAQAV